MPSITPASRGAVWGSWWMYTRWARAPPSAWRSWVAMMPAGSLLAAIAAEHQVELDWVGWPAGFDPSRRDRRGLPAGKAQAGLLAAVMAERLDGERWQGEDCVAGSGLDWPDGQLLARAAGVAIAVASDARGEGRGVDDGERLAEPGGAGVQVQVGPFQAAQFAVAGAGRRRQHRPGAKPW
jgi:hypothetical protein